MTKHISAQPSVTFAEHALETAAQDDEDTENRMQLDRTQSVSTFTRHTNSIKSIIKQIILGIIVILQMYTTIKISK